MHAGNEWEDNFRSNGGRPLSFPVSVELRLWEEVSEPLLGHAKFSTHGSVLVGWLIPQEGCPGGPLSLLQLWNS